MSEKTFACLNRPIGNIVNELLLGVIYSFIFLEDCDSPHTAIGFVIRLSLIHI